MAEGEDLNRRLGSAETSIAVLKVEVGELRAGMLRQEAALAALQREMRDGQQAIREEMRHGQEATRDEMRAGFTKIENAVGAAHLEAMKTYPADAAKALARSERSNGMLRGVLYAAVPVVLGLLAILASHLWK